MRKKSLFFSVSWWLCESRAGRQVIFIVNRIVTTVDLNFFSNYSGSSFGS